MIAIGNGLTTSTTTKPICDECSFRTATGCLLIASIGYYRPQTCQYFKPKEKNK
jgi:hypothetical protein